MGYADTYASNHAAILRDLARSQAEAKLQSGQGWANALGQIGQIAANVPGQLSAEKDAKLQRAAMERNLARWAKQDQADTWMSDAMNSAYDPKTGTFDKRLLSDALTAVGAAQLVPRAVQVLEESEAATQRLKNYQMEGQINEQNLQAFTLDTLRPLAVGLKESNMDPATVNAALTIVGKFHGPAEEQRMRQLLLDDPKSGMMFVDSLVTPEKDKPSVSVAKDAGLWNPNTGTWDVERPEQPEQVGSLSDQFVQARAAFKAATLAKDPAAMKEARDEMNAILRDMGSVANATRPPQQPREEPTITPNESISATMRLRSQYATETKAARDVKVQYDLMKSSLEAVKSGAAAPGSQGVLVTFQKILDPTSVVRESEYARSSAGLSLLSNLQGRYDRLIQGGAGVPVKDLEDFVSLAGKFADNQARAATATRGQIESIVQDYKLNPKSIFIDMESASGAGETTSSGLVSANNPPPDQSGNWKMVNGKWVKRQ